MFEGPFTTSRTDELPSRDRALQFIHRLSRKAPIHLRHYFAEPKLRRRFTHRLSRGHHPPLPSVLSVVEPKLGAAQTPSSTTSTLM